VVDAVQFDARPARATRWREDLEPAAGAVADARYADGTPAVVRHGRSRYVGCWLDDAGWQAVLGAAARDAGLAPQPLPEGLRTSRVGGFVVACNFSDHTVQWAPSTHAGCLIGGRDLAPRGVSLWKAAPSA
jgi:beta-galactosidase